MESLPEALVPLAAYQQFILYKLVPSTRKPGKMDKFPVDHRTLQVYLKDSNWQSDPAAWTSHEIAIRLARMCGDDHGVGFFFTAQDPFFFLDIDGCLTPENTWSPVANDLMTRLSGCAVELSQSGAGLHIFGQGGPLEHRSRDIHGLGLEFYTQKRFVALTGLSTVGTASFECNQAAADMVATYFPPQISLKDATWSTEPVEEWTGTEDDDELIAKAMAVRTTASAFNDGASNFKALWTNDEDALAVTYPDPNRTYDASTADAALAQHLAFWTGKNCQRIHEVMLKSALVRDKWEREDYLIRTILRAVSLQETVYSIPKADHSIAEEFGAVKLKASSESQRTYAETVRSQKLQQCAGDVVTIELFCKVPKAKFWLDNKDCTVDELLAKIKPLETAPAPVMSTTGPIVVSGFQYLGATQQIEYFKGCVYIQDRHAIFTPTGAVLKSEQFKATYGGYVFQMDDTGEKVTRNAWDAFTESQVVRFPKAESTTFQPSLAPGEVIIKDGQALVNTYIPVETPKLEGDITPFVTHLAKVLPNPMDQSILLAYMAACVQHKGVKFQWAPLLQGTPGNGKTLFTRCVGAAIGQRHTHLPPSENIAEKFNDWLFDKLFIGVEDVYIPEKRTDIIQTLLPMITNDRLAMRAMLSGQVMRDVCANFMLNANKKDAIRKTRDDRRFAVFFTAQQTIDDLVRDGMTGDYFKNLYDWLKADGYAIVNNFLYTYPIPDELNPATSCHRAPLTSSTDEAILATMGSVEQEIAEAIAEGRVGFAGGWVSSVAIERVLDKLRMTRQIPINRRRELMQSLGYDWHPALKDGRVNNKIQMDENKKPKLFIKKGHIATEIKDPATVSKTYQEAQAATADDGVVIEARFKN